MSHLFRSFNGGRPRVQTADEQAADLAMEMIEAIKARRLDAKTAELTCAESVPWQPEDQAHIDTLEALLKGRHRPVVLPLILEHFPELIAPEKTC